MTIGTKEWFLKEMNSFLLKKKENDEFIDKVYDLFGAQMADVIGQHQYETDVIYLIQDIIGDTNGWIEYFVYECDGNFEEFNEKVEIDGISTDVTCLSDLYDFINRFEEWINR